LAVSHDTQTKVAHWQQQVQLGLHDFEPSPAPKQVWSRIATQLGHQSAWQYWLNNLKLWQGISASAVSLALILAVSPWPNGTGISPNLVASTAAIQSPDLNYVIHNSQQNPAWIVNASLTQHQFSIDTIAPDPIEQGKVCELWLILDSGEPISLGLLPKQGRMQVDFDSRITSLNNWQRLLNEGQLVISLEGMAGASRGYDMGPVLDKGSWIAAMAGPVISL
jgi:anti-sigma-K factor RskA